jgi:hypothetical protein
MNRKGSYIFKHPLFPAVGPRMIVTMLKCSYPILRGEGQIHFPCADARVRLRHLSSHTKPLDSRTYESISWRAQVMRQFYMVAVGNITASRVAMPTGRCNYNSLHSYARRAPFESRSEHRLSWWFSSVTPGKFCDNNFVRLRLNHFKVFPVCQSYVGIIFG